MTNETVDFDDMSLDEFDAELERIEHRNNSILYVALNAALENALTTYITRRDETLDINDPDQRGTPEHLTLLRQYEAAKQQIEEWRRAL